MTLRSGLRLSLIHIFAAKSPQYNFSSHELQRYFEALSGARLEIVPVESAKQNQRNVAFSLLGGTDANDLIKDPTAMRLVQLDGLKRGGFVLRSCEYDGHHALVVTGNDAPSTRYAVYDLQAEYSITTVRTECIFRVAEPDVTPNRSSG